MAERELKASVVVISFNQIAKLKRLVTQLLEQELSKQEYEIVIVDDASTDGTSQWLNEITDARVKHIPFLSNRGRSAARNAGIAMGSGDVVVLIDADHAIECDFLADHLAYHQDSECVMVGRSVLPVKDEFRALSIYLNGTGAVKITAGTRIPGRYFVTGNCSLKKSVLQRVGAFDESFHMWGGEDLDYGKRLEIAEIPIFGAPNIVAQHDHLRTLNYHLKRIREFGNSAIPKLLEKHPQLFQELNLDHTIQAPIGRFGTLHRFFFRIIFAEPFYQIVKWKSQLLRRFRLPRFIFDYLHLRQYTMGYLDYLRSKNRTAEV